VAIGPELEPAFDPAGGDSAERSIGETQTHRTQNNESGRHRGIPSPFLEDEGSISPRGAKGI